MKILLVTSRELDEKDLSIFLDDLKIGLPWLNKERLIEECIESRESKQTYQSIIKLPHKLSEATTSITLTR